MGRCGKRKSRGWKKAESAAEHTAHFAAPNQIVDLSVITCDSDGNPWAALVQSRRRWLRGAEGAVGMAWSFFAWLLRRFGATAPGRFVGSVKRGDDIINVDIHKGHATLNVGSIETVELLEDAI